MKKKNQTSSPIWTIDPLTVYRTPQLCKLLGISHVTLWHMVQAGKLPPPIKITGNINAWLATCSGPQ
jgi:hypothetical protein